MPVQSATNGHRVPVPGSSGVREWLRLALSPLSRTAALGLFCCLGLATGCSAPPYAASTNSVLVPEDLHKKKTLTAAEQSQLRAAFDELAVGHKPVNSYDKSSGKLRWSDVPNAVAFACDDAEMGIVRTVKRDWGYEFQLRTIEDYPAQLIVKRTHDDRVYKATAVVGHFEDHQDRAAALIKALDKQMKAFAEVPRPPEDDGAGD